MLPSLATNPEETVVDIAETVVAKAAVTVSARDHGWARSWCSTSSPVQLTYLNLSLIAPSFLSLIPLLVKAVVQL